MLSEILLKRDYIKNISKEVGIPSPIWHGEAILFTCQLPTLLLFLFTSDVVIVVALMLLL
jgi:hypothetical protein